MVVLERTKRQPSNAAQQTELGALSYCRGRHSPAFIRESIFDVICMTAVLSLTPTKLSSSISIPWRQKRRGSDSRHRTGLHELLFLDRIRLAENRCALQAEQNHTAWLSCCSLKHGLQNVTHQRLFLIAFFRKENCELQMSHQSAQSRIP